MRRRLVLTAAAVGLLALLAAAGRLERAHWIETERGGMDDVYSFLGHRFLTRTISDVYDSGQERPGLSCLRYAYGGDPYAIQVCFDGRGRLVEVYDERSGKVVIHDLHEEPAESGLRIDPKRLKQIRRYVVSTQDEIRRAQERADLLAARRKARAGRK